MTRAVHQKCLASIIIVTYNHRQYLETCLQSVMDQEYPHEIIIVDNGSNDGTCEFIEHNFPHIKMIHSCNRGYGVGNNIGVKYSNGIYLIFLNPDVIVGKDWLRELIAPLINRNMVITTPKILLFDGLKINTCGNINHFTGLTFVNGFGKSSDNFPISTNVTGFSGACFGIKKRDFIDLGEFDERFFLYNEDSELSWRAHLNNFSILYVATSVMRHDYKLSISPEKMFHLELGRYIILRKFYSLKQLFLLAPSFFVVELLTTGYSIKNGRKYVSKKCKAHIQSLLTSIEKVNGNEEDLINNLSVEIPDDIISNTKFEKKLIHIANKLFKLNRKIVK